MFLSLSLIILVGLSMAQICKRLKLPRIIGMLITGIALGPYALDMLDASILGISSELRQIALIIILIKAGLSLDIADLKRVGRSATLMSFLPACFEILGYFLFAPLLLNISRIDAAVMGAVLGAVSPAVVVPRMVQLIEARRGTDKSIPQLILAGASCDDIFVIVLFSTFTGMAQGSGAKLADFLNIPVSIALGVAVGAAAGYALWLLFEFFFRREQYIRNSFKVILMLGTAFMLIALETLLKDTVAFSGLLAVVSMACVIKAKGESSVSARLSAKFSKLWLAAEVLLFVLVGAAVDIRYTLSAGAAAIAMIFIALIFRSVGVMVSLIGSPLNAGERLFCIVAYLPKATVQAAIGSIPLSLGLSCGNAVLSVAVLAILITAPLGAIGIDALAPRLLNDGAAISSSQTAQRQ